MFTRFRNISHLYLWGGIAILIIIVAIYQLYESSREGLYDASIQQHQKQVERDISNIIEERQNSAISISLALSEDDAIHDFLCENCKSKSQKSLDFDGFIKQLHLQTLNGLIWVQVIDNKGVSRYRSWTSKTGDSLKEVRYDIRQMLDSPKVQQGISVGRYSLTFKSMVPILDQNKKMLGMIEIITHMDALSKRLSKTQKLSSVILVDKRFQQQLVNADKNRFLNGFYIVNSDAEADSLDRLQAMTEQRFAQIMPVQVADGKVVTQYLLVDSLGRLMGYWFTFTDLADIDWTDLRLLNKQYLYTSIIVTSLVLLLLWIYALQRKTEKRRKYYRNILNATSEIILVTNRTKIIDANQLFFDFYSDYRSIGEFLKHYDCVCETFEEGNGYLQKQMGEQYWLDYVLENADQEHIAKVSKDGQPHYFQVKVASIELDGELLYPIILHDVTQQIIYKKQLEHIAETDSLTGIANRLVFNRRLSEEINRANRYEKDLCLALFDIDHFKSINDNYGHDAGDRVLKLLSMNVSSMLRETDLFCRVGGEEFGIIMPETQLQDARMVMERLRIAVANINDLDVKNLTISIGLSYMVRWDSDTVLFKKTDLALYKAKKAGRNCVMIGEEV